MPKRTIVRAIADPVIDLLGKMLATWQGPRRRAHRLEGPISRRRFSNMVKERPALEIGPFDSPVLSGENVFYFDILGQADLRRTSIEHGRDPQRTPEINYVSPTGDLRIVDRTFEAVFSSHVIEHQPDIIEHLNEVGRLLVDGGRYFLMVPDRRYSFDHFIPESQADEMIAAHRAQHTVHTKASIKRHLLATTHNRALKHWVGLHGRPSQDEGLKQNCKALCSRAGRGEYIDVHAWIFTPSSFAQVIRSLFDRGLIGLQVETIHDTGFGRLEFYAVMRKHSAIASGG